MDEADRLNFLIDKLRSEKDTSPEKVAERLELLKAAKMLETMLDMHMDEDTEEEAEARFEITGERRNYGRERGRGLFGFVFFGFPSFENLFFFQDRRQFQALAQPARFHSYLRQLFNIDQH